MADWVSISINLALGLPVAAVVIVVARELSRALAAPILGFRVFEIQWGAGPWRGRCPVGPLDLACGPLPIAGATVARSGSPRHHRLARILLAIAPISLQLAWLIGRVLTGTPPGTAPLFSGLAPLACLDLMNAILLVAHVTLAIEISPGVRTDMRLLLDALLSRGDSGRAARANYYARLARHHLERAQVGKARNALDLGRTQLGPEALLVGCQARLDATDLDSVVDQGDCIADIEALIESAEPERTQERAAWTFRERLRQGLASAVPLTAALLVLAFIQADHMTRSIESRLLRLAETAADSLVASECEALQTRWEAWAARVDPWMPPPAVTRSDRHLGFAKLATCRGDTFAASAHQGEALLAANAAQTEDAEQLFSNPERWLENQMRMASLLRHAARMESDQRRYRDALRTLHKATNRLNTLQGQLSFLGAAQAQALATTDVERERAAVEAMRQQVVAGMSQR